MLCNPSLNDLLPSDILALFLFYQLEVCTGQSITTGGESEGVSPYAGSPMATGEGGDLSVLSGDCEGGPFLLLIGELRMDSHTVPLE